MQAVIRARGGNTEILNTKVRPTNRYSYSNKKGGCGLIAQNDIHRSLFHNEAGSLPFVIVIRM
jgi:hypothetical protein